MTSAEIRKTIHVTGYNLDRTGLQIVYRYNEKVFNIIADPESAANVLRDSAFIDEFHIKDGQLMLTIIEDAEDANGNVVEQPKHIEWKEYVMNNPISQFDAIIIAGSMEYLKYLNNRYETNKKEARESIQKKIKQTA